MIISKEYNTLETYQAIKELEAICYAQDQTALKLELDYKFQSTRDAAKSTDDHNEFLYYLDKRLVGYMGICCFGGSTPEITGMVHPDHRRKGIFTNLMKAVAHELSGRHRDELLLLSDRKSDSGQAFIKSISAVYQYSEYEMFLHDEVRTSVTNINLRKATNADMPELMRQDALYFGSGHLVEPEEEEKKGMTIYLAEEGDRIIGKVNLQLINGIGGIYGLGVIPEFRQQGFGRGILMQAIEQFKFKNAQSVMLQVEAKNSNALDLYCSVGFKETSTMDYYKWEIKHFTN